jgi:hypothetical protein
MTADQARFHQKNDPPLMSDIAAVARGWRGTLRIALQPGRPRRAEPEDCPLALDFMCA